MEDTNLDKMIDDRIKMALPRYLQQQGFTHRKLTDTPNDALQMVNRRFVTNNGSVAGRPVSSVATVGQSYAATDTGIPMIYFADGWHNGVGSVVALNN